MEVSVLVEHLAVERVALVISPCDGGAFEQNLVVLAYLNVKTADRATYRPTVKGSFLWSHDTVARLSVRP